MYSKKFLGIFFMYFVLQNPNLKSIFVRRYWKTLIIREKTNIVLKAYNNGNNHVKPKLLGRGEQDR